MFVVLALVYLVGALGVGVGNDGLDSWCRSCWRRRFLAHGSYSVLQVEVAHAAADTIDDSIHIYFWWLCNTLSLIHI